MGFDEVKRNFGFGCMRLPFKGIKVDGEEFSAMVDAFLENGFNYFDTAHNYLMGKSETAIRDYLAARHPRESFLLADKLTENYFRKQSDIRPFFEKQLKACGVEYFDFYLMHAQNARNFRKYKQCKAYETAFELKREGKVRHVGFSFHDSPAVLDEILTTYPDVEFVQLQFNYLDFESPKVQSRRCYEVCRNHQKPVIVMEPVKGGLLARLPDPAGTILDDLHGGSRASYAIRFAAGFEGVFMVLSGMSDLAQMKDNLEVMKDFKPLTAEEHAAVLRVRAMLSKRDYIPCTACRYCIEGCPKKISIPDLFACLNKKRAYKDGDGADYAAYAGGDLGKASDCIGCGRCEASCPQHLEIRKLLKEVAAQFE